jgi:acyl-CoA thioester hydrolase
MVEHSPSRSSAIEVLVVDADMDEFGHASNISYVRWIQDVARAHSNAVGFDTDAYRTLGALFFVRRHEIDYVRPVVAGDRLELRTWIDSASAAACKRATEIVAPGGVVAARAMTTWAYVDIASGRPKRIPDTIRSAFGMPTTAHRND